MFRLMFLAALLLAGPSLPTAGHAADAGYDLVANAPLAHVYRDGVVADAAAPGFVKYIRDMNGSWALGVQADGRTGALLPGLQANVWLPVDADLAGQALVMEAGFKPLKKAGRTQRCDVFIEGDKIGSLELSDGWQMLRVKIPSGKVKSVLVKVRLHFSYAVDHPKGKSAGIIRFVRIAPESSPQPVFDEAALAGNIAPVRGGALQLNDGGGLDYYITPVKGMTLQGKASGGTVEVFAQLDGKKPQRLGGGAELSVNLDKVADKAVRLMLRGKGGTVALAGARIAGGTLKTPALKKPKYVLFWLIDTLRADKLPFYDIPNANGRPKVKTPHLSKLAAEATVFEPFWVQGNESKASHASLFTGTYPTKHGVYTHKAKLKDSHTTLAEAFKKAGFKTGGFVSNGYVSDRWNFAQGFSAKDFTNTIREGKANNAKALVRSAKKWVDANKDKPFYLYMGTSDPHVTYRRHKEFIDQYDREGGYNGRYMKSLSGTELGKLKGKKRPPSQRDQTRIEALYENEIAFNDKWFGEMVAHLQAAGIWDETLVIISSDHGDEFWEHGSCGHGHNLHQELINVPLVIRWPGMFPATRATFGAGGVDLLPTIQTMLGQERPGDVQGSDLLPFVGAQGAVYPRAMIASQGRGSYALQVGPAKVIMRSERSITAYDVKADPAEKTDVFGSKVVTTLAAMDPLSVFLSRADDWDKAKMGSPNNLSGGF